jgi:predicted 3-demethylubiquinone-9 3-methyltransferase (glyoxalase superfamily)
MNQPGVMPFLMFEGRAEEAMAFYVGLIPRSEVLEVARHGADGPGAKGSIAVARFVLDGLTVMCSDSAVQHDFTFTPSASLFVTCETAAEVDRIAGALAADGAWLMPLDDYGFSPRFAWVNDRFGVSWQVSAGPPRQWATPTKT